MGDVEEEGVAPDEGHEALEGHARLEVQREPGGFGFGVVRGAKFKNIHTSPRLEFSRIGPNALL